MARKFEINPGQYAWHPERCEEVVIIAAYQDIERYIAPDTKWHREFEYMFFEQGKGLAAHNIAYINAERARKKMSPVTLVETNVGDYPRYADYSEKAEQRQRLRSEMAAMNKEALAKIVAAARAEVAALEPPHRPYEEWKWQRKAVDDEMRRSKEQVRRRLIATAAANGSLNGHANDGARVVVAVPDPDAIAKRLDKVLKKLTLATDPELHAQVIGTLNEDESLALAERIEVEDLRNALIRHSLTA